MSVVLPPALSDAPDQAGALTRRQREVLRALRRLLASTAHPVTLDALCAALGLSSRGSLHKHVQALVSAGLLEPPRGLRRGLALTRAGRVAAGEVPMPGELATGDPTPQASPVSPAPVRRAARGEVSRVRVEDVDSTLPLLGRVAAGRPIEALEGAERFDPGSTGAGSRGSTHLKSAGTR